MHDKHIYLTTVNLVLFLLHFYPVWHYSYKLKAGITIEYKPEEKVSKQEPRFPVFTAFFGQQKPKIDPQKPSLSFKQE